MYRVKLYPSKAPRDYVWLEGYKDGDEKDLSDGAYRSYSKIKGFVVPIERYIDVTVKKEICKCCGHTKPIRERKILETYNKQKVKKDDES